MALGLYMLPFTALTGSLQLQERLLKRLIFTIVSIKTSFLQKLAFSLNRPIKVVRKKTYSFTVSFPLFRAFWLVYAFNPRLLLSLLFTD